MPDMIKYVKFTTDAILALLSETMDDYLYLQGIQGGTFYISDHTYKNLEISRRIETDIVSVWPSIVILKSQKRWLTGMRLIRDGAKDCRDMEYRVYNRSGQTIWVSRRGTVGKGEGGRPLFMIGRISNTGKQDKLDNVTGLMSQNQFKQDTELLLKQEQDVQGAMVVPDVDNFKSINEKYSCALGDRALNPLSALISSLLPKECQPYHLDGDKFVFLLENSTEEGVRYIYENIQMIIGSHFMVKGRPITISVSAGACFLPRDGETCHKLFRNAKNAVKVTKMNGKNQPMFFSEGMYKQKLRMMELQGSLHTYVKEGFRKLGLFYQPQVETGTDTVIGAEALLQWHSPEHGEISPTEFIPLLEESRLIAQVGAWVLKESMKQYRKRKTYALDFIIGMNVSCIQLKENGLLKHLRARQKDYTPARGIILELTESCRVPNLHFLNEEFRELYQAGYGVAISDSGTGCSSLSRLKELPASVLKIDRGFVTGISKGSYECIFLEYIIKFAHSISLEVCVEGVEASEEFEVVKQATPGFIQGCLLGRPVSASESGTRYLL